MNYPYPIFYLDVQLAKKRLAQVFEPERDVPADNLSAPSTRSRPTVNDQNTSHSHLSTDLETLHSRLEGKSLTISQLKQALKGRGTAMLLILLALPFCFVAIPGLSMPFGVAICLIGACLVSGREPWLPRFIMRWRLSSTRLAQLLSGAIKLARHLEKSVRPRLAFLHTVPGTRQLNGVGVIIAGLALMLPLPIPFSNSIPAWAIVFLAIGMMEKDGLFVLLGHLTAIATWIFIGLTTALAVGWFQGFLEVFSL
jgi:hypothetical protein